MSHPSQMSFIETLSNIFPEYFRNIKMLEIGSLNINGSIRKFFKDCMYVGVDLDNGKEVDVVCEGQLLDHPDNTYDTSGSCNCFEHNPHWIATFKNMHRMTKQNGLIFIVVPTANYPEHGTSRTDRYSSPLTISKGWEYYKNLSVQDFYDNLDMDSMFHTYKFQVNDTPEVLFYGFKK